MGKAKRAGARRQVHKAPAGAFGGLAKANPNPFEVKVNRQKFHILGRKTRHDVGLPGVSRARAIRKRTQTLLKEYKERNKSNVFTDKRFGEYNSNISPEEKMMKRFALEQQRHHEKKNIYNLNEDEELTHYGQSLADIEKHNDIVDSDNDTEERGTLSDAYDIMVRELGFEMKAQPSNRMKTEEELAKEEQERLKKLEAERLRRMLGKDEDENKRKPKHMSADDLNDGFILDKDDRRLLSYKDGKMNIENVQEEQSKEAGGQESDQKEDEDESDEEEGEDESREDTEESDGSDSHSDLESNTESEEENEKPKKEQHQTPWGKLPSDDQKVQKAAGAELPYVFAAPESYEELRSLLSGRSMEEQLLVVERIQKCNHPSLAVGNKAKLEKLFGFLLQYVGDLATDSTPDLETIDKLIVQLYNLCQKFPESASDSIKFVLRDAMHEMEEMIETKGRALFPGLDVLIYLKITGLLFPTSDFWHPVVTPALMCMSQMLTKCPVLSLQDVIKGLFVCCLFLDYVALSRRFIPELLNFLLGILYIATPNTKSQGSALVHPFRALGKNSELLVVSDKADMATWQKGSLSLHWASRLSTVTATEANHTRLSCLASCLTLLKHCVLMYSVLPSFHAIIKPHQALLTEHLVNCSLPQDLQELSRSILSEMESQKQHCQPLICEKSKPVPLKLFTPQLVKVLEFGRKQGSTKEEQERKRLIHKHKREFKGAVREIRKDNQFLARMQLSEIMERDAERKRKVKQLFNSLATQEELRRRLSNTSEGPRSRLHLSAGRIQASSRRLASRKRRGLLQSLRGVAAIQGTSLSIYLSVSVGSCGRVGASTMGWAGDTGCTPRPPIRPRPVSERRVVTVIFLGLLLDLLAFTLLLPLLPGLLENHGREQDPLYGSWQRGVDWFATVIGMPAEKRYNSVLFGGLIGSAFSLLQFFSAPLTGAASDCLGRRPVMLLCLTGMAISYAVWAASRSFKAFLASRVIGGISKGNVSLSTAIVADLGSPPTRSQGMAVIGVAFSLAFTVGPMLGAFLSVEMVPWISLLFAVSDMLFIFCFLPETLPQEKRAPSVTLGFHAAANLLSPLALLRFAAVTHHQDPPAEDRLRSLRRLGLVYFLYLFLFSGLEYTLSFLVHQRFQFSSLQQGKMFFFIGLTMATIQGTYARRISPGKEVAAVKQAMLLLVPAFLFIGWGHSLPMLGLGLLLYSFAAAVVVPGLSTLVSSYGESPPPKATQGRRGPVGI
ncbi:nucleolar protein 14 [Cricetulus griseus]|nr:nucleolar protein 14 [Cricetulus griseus]